MTTSVDIYFEQGCGRCPLGGTVDCKVHSWTTELHHLRKILLDSGLTEESKWGVACYTFQNKNVLLLSTFKEHCAISFFKGVLLKDALGLLKKPGENSQASRLLKFTDIGTIKKLEPEIKAYVFEAIEVEKAGLKVIFKKRPEPLPEELEEKFRNDPTLKVAFEGLTPGRQRGYILFFSAPKQSKTRMARIEKSIGKILNGEGLHDKYSRKRK